MPITADHNMRLVLLSLTEGH